MAGSVVVTGASSGIGAATVASLVEGGFSVWATVRRESDAELLRERHGAVVRTLIMDLEDEESVRRAGETVVADGPLVGLVNNAGAAWPGPLEYLPIEAFRRQLEVNLTAQLLVTQVLLPALRASVESGGEARIVIMGSIGGRISGPMLGGYAASKHGLVALAGSLRAELAPSRIKVLLVEPGAISTPIWTRGPEAMRALSEDPVVLERYGAQLKNAAKAARQGDEKGLPPRAVGEVVLRALTAKNPPPRQLVGNDAKVLAGLVRVLPHRALYRMLAARS